MHASPALSGREPSPTTDNPAIPKKTPDRWPYWGPFFHFGRRFPAISGRPFSILFPILRDFCVGLVCHSVDGHFDRNPTTQECKKTNTAFTRTFQKSSHGPLSASCDYEPGTQQKLSRKTRSDELLYWGGFWGMDFPPGSELLWGVT